MGFSLNALCVIVLLCALVAPGACRSEKEQLAPAVGAGNLPKLIFDLMQQNFTGKNFSEERWTSFTLCMQETSVGTLLPQLTMANKIWEGFVLYALASPTSDPWGRRAGWLEWNPQRLTNNNRTVPGAANIIITEPCDTVSNLAYYTGMLSLCLSQHDLIMPKHTRNMLAASFNTLAAGSAFFHASGTSLGGTLDTVPIGHIALTSLQQAVHELPRSFVVANALPQNRSSERTLNGTQLIEDLSLVYLQKDLYSWNELISATSTLYRSDYFVTFGAIVLVIARLALPVEFVDKALPIVAKIMSLTPEDTAFLLQEYDPILQKILGNRTISQANKDALIQRSIGTLIKMFYAFFWQEGVFKGPWLVSAKANAVGGWLIPLVNAVGDMISGYDHPEYVKESFAVYPGDVECKRVVAHAKWHEQSANALIDLIYLLDDAHKVILGLNLTNSTNSSLPHPSPPSTPDVNAATADVHAAHPAVDSPHADAEPHRPDTCFYMEEEALEKVLASAETACLARGGPDAVICLTQLWTGQHTMDGCLVQNDCLAVDPLTGKLDISSVTGCVQASCLRYVHSPVAAMACLDKCTSDSDDPAVGGLALCAAKCMASHTSVSPKAAALVHCWSEVGPASGVTAASVSKFAQCMYRQHLASDDRSTSPLWGAILRLATQCSPKHSGV